MNRKAVVVWLMMMLIVAAGINAQDVPAQLKNTPFAKMLAGQSGIGGNSTSDLFIEASPAGDIIWAGTSDGVSRFDPVAGEWTTFNEEDGLGKGSVSAISQFGDEIWVATGFDSAVATGGSTWYGGGLAYTSDDGQTWTHIVQPGETRVAGQNVTWDIAFLDDTIWITSWGGGLRKSTDHGETWTVVTPDGFVFDAVHNNNHNSWSAKSFDDVLWVGTADGVNKSLDNGNTWTQFTHQNQDQPLTGNWVREIACQDINGQKVIWLVCWVAGDGGTDASEIYGLSKSDDQGYSWTTCLEGERLFNVAFDGETVYAVGENGLFKSENGGESWNQYPQIVDEQQSLSVYTDEYYSVAFSEDASRLWVGTTDGLATTTDNGLNWYIYRKITATGQSGEPRTYAFPTPFSPSRMNNLDGDGFVRIQYNTTEATSVTVKVYDFAMELVKTVVTDQQRPAGDFSEVWDCRNGRYELVANGVYFYSVDIAGDGTYWGKIMIIE